MSNSPHTAVWLLGRGCSIACGLRWTPSNWYSLLPRRLRVERIKRVIRREMANPAVDTSLYGTLLKLLASMTVVDWHHRFITTNWDSLLEREIQALELSVKPKWMASSHVYHLNGSAEQCDKDSFKSPFLLESDPTTCRTWSVEANKTLNYVIAEKFIIVAGMSFKCPTDQSFLKVLGSVEDDLQIGEALWIIVNSNAIELREIKGLLARRFPNGKFVSVNEEFGNWVNQGCPQLRAHGILH